MPIGADGYWYDDGTDDPEDYGLLPDGTDPASLAEFNNPFLGGSGLPMIPMDVDTKTGRQMPFNVQTLGRQNNAFQDTSQMIFNPQTAILASLLGGGGGLDYMQLLGGGGAAGGGTTAASPPATPLLNMYANSGDDVLRGIYEGFSSGTKTPVEMKNQIRIDYADDPDTADNYISAVDDAWKEASQALSFQQTPAKPNPLEQVFLEAGLPSPLEEYGPENLPADLMPDLANNQFLQRTAASTLGQEAMLNRLRKEAQYRKPITPRGPGATIDFGGAGDGTDVNVNPMNPALNAAVPGITAVGPLLDKGTNSPLVSGAMPGLPALGAIAGEVGGLFGTPDITASFRPAGTPLIGRQPAPSGGGVRTKSSSNTPGRKKTKPGYVPGTGFDAYGPVRTIKDKQMQPNEAGQRVYALRRSIDQNRQFESDVQQGIKQFSAILATQAGRSPTSDAVQARIDALRRMGIGI